MVQAISRRSRRIRRRLKYLLDTNTISFLMRGESRVRDKLTSLSRADVHLCQPVVAEIGTVWPAFHDRHAGRACVVGSTCSSKNWYARPGRMM